MERRAGLIVSPRGTRIFRILFICALIGVTVVSVIPLPQVDGFGSDKLGHFIAYTVLTLLLVLSLSGERVVPRGFWFALAAVLVYGALIEVLQRYVGRYFEVKDMLANGGGVLLGAGTGLLARLAFRANRHL